MNVCDLQAYMELIVELEPKSVLDAGMIMREFALVSRRAANCIIPPHVRLTGLDFFPERAFPIEKRIYDRVLAADEFMNDRESYDFAAMFNDEFPPGIDKNIYIRKLALSSRYFITYHANHEFFPEELLPDAQSITIDKTRYVMSRRI